MDTNAARIIRDKIIELEKEYKELDECLLDVNIPKETVLKSQVKNLYQRAVLSDVLQKIVFGEEK